MRTVLLAAGLLTFTAPALAQFSSDTQVENRLSRIENEISTLSRAIYKGDRTALSQTGQNFRSAQERADAGARMDALEQRIRELNGMLEEQAHNNRMLKRELDKINQDMSLRLQDLEGKQSTSVIASRAAQPTTPNMQTPTQLTPTKHPKTEREPSPASTSTIQTISSGNAAQAYDAAFSKLKSGQYNQAQLLLEDFLKNHPNDGLASNARYWLGETFYVRGQYEDAVKAFAQGYQAAPKGPKAPDNLLKLGISLAATDKKTDACVALKQVAKEFSAGPASILRRADQEAKRLACG